MIGYWLCVAFVLAIAIAALLWASHMEDKLHDERLRSKAFEQRGNELYSQKLQAEAQRDSALSQLEEERAGRAALRLVRGGKG